MVGHKICSNGEIWLIIPKLSLLPLLIWSTAKGSLEIVVYEKDRIRKYSCHFSEVLILRVMSFFLIFFFYFIFFLFVFV